ncbi:unnamed protein product [Brachionus calyciflorus]|uniref:Uncharacterized protein n=1 Tax=Brachionus calyciflorus TaxID=104777 RepID=A0A814ECS2_9BILA|nr:unnamed protein product [Brachionus calyciflorus]
MSNNNNNNYNNKTFQIKKRFLNRQQNNSQKRLSCEELESLKERFVDFIDSSLTDLPAPPPPDTRQLSRLSMSSESTNTNSSTSSSITKPEPPTRTVSIKNFDDTLSIKSIYSSCRGSILNQPQAVRSSRSVFSIYEEEDESLSIITNSSSSSSSSSSSNCSTSKSFNIKLKLERLNDFEIEKIESVYRSIGCMVNVSQCTCDLLSTTNDDIASSLNKCWKIKYNSIVVVLVFDTGYNPKRPKQLKLIFADRKTGFPLVDLPEIKINYFNLIKYPNLKEKCLTFKLNPSVICLIKFYDFFSCTEFFRFYSDIVKRNSDLIEVNNENLGVKQRVVNKKMDKSKRKSECISEFNLRECTIDNKRFSHFITITKHCISRPCAFQHVNSLKNDADHVKSLIESTSKLNGTNICDETISKRNSKLK